MKWKAIMKLSTLLLSSAALVVAGTAYAADLPAKKGAPAAKTGCPAFGAGFFQVPGSDTCLGIGGFVRSNNSWTVSTVSRGTAPYSLDGAAYLYFDAKNNTDIGTVSSYIAFYGDSSSLAVDESFLQAAGLTAGYKGRVINSVSVGGAFSSAGMLNSTTSPMIDYSMALGGSTLSVGLESANNLGNGSDASRPDITAHLSTKAGSANIDLIGISHEAAGATSGSVNAYVVGGKVGIETGGAKFAAMGAYSRGYAFMVSNGGTYDDTDATSSTSSQGSVVGASVSVPVGGNTVSAAAMQYNVSDEDGTQEKWTSYRVNYKAVIAKGLFARPEYQISTGDTSSQTVFLRIQRDF